MMRCRYSPRLDCRSTGWSSWATRRAAGRPSRSASPRSRSRERPGAHDATVTSFIGTQVRTMLRQEPGASDRAHRVRRAWFALNVSAAERAAFEERFAIRLYNGYGLTEAFTSVTQAPLD